MRIDELGCRVGRRDSEDTQACQNSRLRIFDHQTLARLEQRWSGRARIHLPERELIDRRVRLPDGALIRRHDQLKRLFDGGAGECGKDLLCSTAGRRCQPVRSRRALHEPDGPGEQCRFVRVVCSRNKPAFRSIIPA